ncbi:DNA-binding transcriptional activator FeaR [compost metagenome]
MKLEDISQSSAVGGRQLQRIVRQSSDMSLSELIQRERIKESCRLLVNPAFTQLSISDIASKVGIHDPKRFYRLFKQMTNETPGQYRKNRLNR